MSEVSAIVVPTICPGKYEEEQSPGEPVQGGEFPGADDYGLFCRKVFLWQLQRV